MKKQPYTKEQLAAKIYNAIINVTADGTKPLAYRKWIDKVIYDIFGIENFVSSIMIGKPKSNLIHLFDDPTYNGLLKFLLNSENESILQDLAHMAYDAAQIYNLPKKKVTNNHIKGYQYLSKKYTKAIKHFRKEYNASDNIKKNFKAKYSMLNSKITSSYPSSIYDLSDGFDADSIFGDDDSDEDFSFENLEEIDFSKLDSHYIPDETPSESPIFKVDYEMENLKLGDLAFYPGDNTDGLSKPGINPLDYITDEQINHYIASLSDEELTKIGLNRNAPIIHTKEEVVEVDSTPIPEEDTNINESASGITEESSVKEIIDEFNQNNGIRTPEPQVENNENNNEPEPIKEDAQKKKNTSSNSKKKKESS